MNLFRLDNDTIFMAQAIIASGGSTCRRRAVGCVLTNKHNHIIAVGRNGVPRGVEHCLTKPCPGANMPSGTGLDSCLSTHAEQNALIQCKDVEDIHTCYVTASPCIHCTRMLLNTSCRRIVFLESYPHASAIDLWVENDREITQVGFSKVLGQIAAAVDYYLTGGKV